MEKIYKNSALGYEVRLGLFARQADGSVFIQKNGTVLLVTAMTERSEEFPGFFPLSVDHRELFSAVGKIPGGYFKREGKPSDKEVLTARLIDRCMRPLFPENYFNKVQITSTVYSMDKEVLPTSLALVAASLALSMSKIPFMGPAGCCEVARVGGNWIVHPNHDQLVLSDVRLVVAGDHEGINMVEGSFSGLSESELVEAMFLGHDEIKKQIAWQQEIIADLKEHLPKEELDVFVNDDWTNLADQFITKESVNNLFSPNKAVRSEQQGSLEKAFLHSVHSLMEEKKVHRSFVANAFDSVLKKRVTEAVFEKGHRLDGRSFTEVRSITSSVSLLPATHGSALFTRGNTQLLASVTLGSSSDEAKIETLVAEDAGPFMLHYNFLPFSVGEARSVRAPGRREVGHGYLAANAVKAVLPDREQFPYTIRVVADTLESDGSSSMATVCSACLALMDAGVPISSMVAGTAMGMIQKSDSSFQVLTDIAGIEDAFGLMDFKVAGTADAVTAIQMDIKYKGGLSRDVFEHALEDARKARLHILTKMKEVMQEPRSKLSGLVPQFVTLKISKDKIGAVIGTGGKVIREITEKTETSINIEDDGLVKIFGQPGPNGLDKAVSWIKAISGEVVPGTQYYGAIKKIAEFGLFVELVPGVDGLVHISTIPKNDQENFKRRYKEGDKLSVIVLDYDSTTGRIRLKIAE